MITMNKMLANCNIAVIVFWRLDINNLDSALSYFNTLNGDVSVVLIQITINVGHQKYIPTRTHNRWGIIWWSIIYFNPFYLSLLHISEPTRPY